MPNVGTSPLGTEAELVSRALAELGVASVSQQAAIASLSQDISATYVEAEVQAISSKVDAILVALRSAGVIAT